MNTPPLKKTTRPGARARRPAAPDPAGPASRKNRDIRDTNRALFEGKWKHVRGNSKKWWSLINDQDLNRLDKSDFKLDKYVVLLQVKYGYTKQSAREEINKRIGEP